MGMYGFLGVHDLCKQDWDVCFTIVMAILTEFVLGDATYCNVVDKLLCLFL